MKKQLITILSLFICSSGVAMDKLPQGLYEGKATWVGEQGHKGNYKVRVLIDGNQIKSKYFYRHSVEKYTYTTKFKDSSFFIIKKEGEKIGEGYCLKKQCHYQTNHFEENMTIKENKIIRFGSKVNNDNRIIWKEQLIRK